MKVAFFRFFRKKMIVLWSFKRLEVYKFKSFKDKKSHSYEECDFFDSSLTCQISLASRTTCIYSAAASVAGASTGASALGAAFLPARRVVFLAALGVLSMFSL